MHALTSPSGLILLLTASFVLGAPFHENSPGDYELAANRPPTDGQISQLMNTAAIQRKMVIRPRDFQWPRDVMGQDRDGIRIGKRNNL